MFVWTTEHDIAFQIVQQALMTTLILSLPNFKATFFIEIQCCGYQGCAHPKGSILLCFSVKP